MIIRQSCQDRSGHPTTRPIWSSTSFLVRCLDSARNSASVTQNLCANEAAMRPIVQ